jgi:hypothetical protein
LALWSVAKRNDRSAKNGSMDAPKPSLPLSENPSENPSSTNNTAAAADEQRTTTTTTNNCDDTEWLEDLALRVGFDAAYEWSRYVGWCKKANKEPTRDPVYPIAYPQHQERKAGFSCDCIASQSQKARPFRVPAPDRIQSMGGGRPPRLAGPVN